MTTRWRRAAAAFVVTLGLASSSALAPAAAQQGDLKEIVKRFEESYAAGNYSAAFIEAQKFEAAVKARYGVNHFNYAGALNNLARVYDQQGKLEEAEAHYKRALVILQEKLGKDHPDVAQILNNLALVLMGQAEWSET